jgi:rhodanese-related sulfurtransferase
MTTIHPVGLATLIDNREPLDLIDVRTEKEFESFHIAGARSVPLKKAFCTQGASRPEARGD